MEGLVYYNEPHRFIDERGFFQEVFNGPRMGHPLPEGMVQVNHSRSVSGVLRGMHWQQPNPTGKFVTCVHGRILDVAVDIRKSSSTFKEWQAFELNGSKGQRLWIPPGFAHGFIVVSATADVVYLQSTSFNEESNRVFRYNDKDVAIRWPIPFDRCIISEQDRNAPLLAELPEDALFD